MSLQEIKQRFGIIGNSPILERALYKAMQVSGTDISVLVSGESGVGKESIPRIIHSQSHRKHSKYIAVNCGAIPQGTIDSELFGHEKGAFTGATGTRKGYFEEADGGTIFLDEVGELPLNSQVRLLRVLETGEFIKVGSSQIQKTDVRIVAATNVDMLGAIQKGRFREDLYYRLNTIEINLPALRERKDDVHLIFRKFAADFSDKYHIPPVRLDEEAVGVLRNYNWPGNIRQLRNLSEQLSVIEHDKAVTAATLIQYLPNAGKAGVPAIYKGAEQGSGSDFSNEREILYQILFDMRKDISDLKKLTSELMQNNEISDEWKSDNSSLIRRIHQEEESNGSPASNSEPSSYLPVYTNDSNAAEVDTDTYDAHHDVVEDEPVTLQEKELEMIKRALDRNHNKRKDAAEELGISERTLYRKIKQYNL
jgi:transcriptional regulator with PAS, ATPase and Fis domain